MLQSKSVDDFDEFIEKNNLIIISPIKKVRTEYKFGETITVAIDEVFLETEIMIDLDDLSVAQSMKLTMNWLKLKSFLTMISL